MIDLEGRLADAAVEMFDKQIASMFTRAKRRKERQYQATPKDLGRLMRLFDQTLAALQGAQAQDVKTFTVLDDKGSARCRGAGRVPGEGRPGDRHRQVHDAAQISATRCRPRSRFS